jgi:hypothetical protein
MTMMPRTASGLLAIVAACLLAGCGTDAKTAGKTPAPEQGHGHHGAHGGALIEVGDHVAHVEVVHDPKAGSVTLHMVGKDGKTPLKLTHAPDLRLVTTKGPKVLETRPVGGDAEGASRFDVTDPVLQADPLEGRIALEIGSKRYNPELEEAREHK